MKIDVEVLDELKKIRNAVDDMFDKLNITLYTKNKAVKVSYKETNPSEYVTSNFEYVSKKLRDLQNSEIVE